MLKYDRIGTLFWTGLAIAICIESIRLGLGSLSVPGPGLVPFGAGLILGFFGIMAFLCTFTGKERKAGPWRPDTQWATLISILLSVIGYAFLIDVLGFFVVTFLWTGFICRGIGKMGWKATILTSLLTTVFCFLVFEYLLNIRFPRGILRF